MRTLCALLLLVSPTLADNCRVVHRNNVVIQSKGAVITPYAVPVAVPVAVVQQGYAYSHAGAQGYAAQSQSADAALFEEFLAWRKAREAQVTTQAVPQTLVQRTCVKCHAESEDAKGHFDMSGELTSDQKLAAIAAVMTGKMPKSKILDPQVRADLVAELSGVQEKSK